LLSGKGAEVHYNDPHIPRLPRTRRHPSLDLSSQELNADYLRDRDCLVIVTDHSAYDWQHILRHARLIVDTRGVTRGMGEAAARVVRA
jgi:UDP-N-acetyl-D-glucosamine dehydrogenase